MDHPPPSTCHIYPLWGRCIPRISALQGTTVQEYLGEEIPLFPQKVSLHPAPFLGPFHRRGLALCSGGTGLGTGWGQCYLGRAV